MTDDTQSNEAIETQAEKLMADVLGKEMTSEEFEKAERKLDLFIRFRRRA